MVGYSPELACYEANLVTNKLTSLEGAPKYISGYFNCIYNKIYSIDYIPEYLGSKNISLLGSPIEYIYKTYIKIIDNIEHFNEFRIIEDDILYLRRLENYASINNYPLPDINKLNDYKII